MRLNIDGRLAHLRSEEGATSVEYGLIAVLVAAVIVGVVAALGVDVLALFETISGKF